MGVRTCTREDFKNDEKAFDLYTSINPNSLVCPEDKNKLKLEGNNNQAKS